MKTFIEEFNNFKENYTLEKLYLKETYSAQNNKKDIFIIILLILVVISYFMIILDFYRVTGTSIFVLSIILMLLYVYKTKIIKARKELLKNHLPVSTFFFAWRSEKLEILRIKYISTKYKGIETNTIQKTIDFAQEQLKYLDKDILSDFEKVTEFFGKNYLLLIIGLFIGLYNKLEYSNENFRSIIKIISYLLFLPYVFTLSWKYYLKTNLIATHSLKKEKLRDYIFAMKNVLLMR